MTEEVAKLTIDYLKSLQQGCVEVNGSEMYPSPEWYALDVAIELVEQERWIPTSERLPEQGQTEGNVTKYYLVQTEHGDRFVASYNNNKWKQIFHYDWEIKDTIVAWMPLPERYKGD